MREVCWKNLIDEAILENSDKFVCCTLTEEESVKVFDNGFGCSEGVPFTAWGEKYVYFPIVYDGSEWVGSAPRFPCDEKCRHQGGE